MESRKWLNRLISANFNRAWKIASFWKRSTWHVTQSLQLHSTEDMLYWVPSWYIMSHTAWPSSVFLLYFISLLHWLCPFHCTDPDNVWIALLVNALCNGLLVFRLQIHIMYVPSQPCLLSACIKGCCFTAVMSTHYEQCVTRTRRWTWRISLWCRQKMNKYDIKLTACDNYMKSRITFYTRHRAKIVKIQPLWLHISWLIECWFLIDFPASLTFSEPSSL